MRAHLHISVSVIPDDAMNQKKQINIILVIIIAALLAIIVIIISYIGRYRADAVRCLMSDIGVFGYSAKIGCLCVTM